MLYGRRAECDALERLLADARRSRSGVLVVRGATGAGPGDARGQPAPTLARSPMSASVAELFGLAGDKED